MSNQLSFYFFSKISFQIPKFLRQLQRPSQPTDLESTETLLIDNIWHNYYGANLKAELLKSDKNQVAIPDETALLNVATSFSFFPEPTLPVSLATTTTSMDPLNLNLPPSKLFNAQCVDR